MKQEGTSRETGIHKWTVALDAQMQDHILWKANTVAPLALVTHSPRKARRILEEQGRRHGTGT